MKEANDQKVDRPGAVSCHGGICAPHVETRLWHDGGVRLLLPERVLDLQDVHGQVRAATRHPYVTYSVSRLWRLLPTFWFVSLITLGYEYSTGALSESFLANNPFHFIISNFFLFGYETLLKQPIAPAWSLDIELQFYVIAPLRAILMARRIVAPIWMLLCVVVLSGASVVFGNHIHLLSCLIFYVIGMSSASSDWKPSPKLVAWSVVTLMFVVVACLASPWRGILLAGAHPGPLAVYTDKANVLLALLVSPFAIYTTGQEGFAHDNMFGDLSYIVYLLHWAAAMWLSHVAFSGGGQRLLGTGAACIVVLGASLVIWKFYDKPINRMRARWVKSRMVLQEKATASH